MLAQVHSPEQLAPRELDAYLELGWFRMGQTIFTTNFLNSTGVLCSTIWLRIDLRGYAADKQQAKLARINGGFRSSIQPAELTEEKEALYALYKQSVSFNASPSLHHLLFSEKQETHSIYNSYEVTVRDGDRLIACGLFDVGDQDAAGIISFYDPAYRKHSLGKQLIYLKVAYCKGLNLRYFYPGYFVPGNSHFDYKLTIGKPALQFLQLSTGDWIPFAEFSDDKIPLQAMQHALMDMKVRLEKVHVFGKIWNYEYFNVNLVPGLRDNGLFEFPIFLSIGKIAEGSLQPIIIFDVHDNLFHLLNCTPVWKPADVNPDENIYSEYLLHAINELHAAPDPGEMCAFIAAGHSGRSAIFEAPSAV